MSRRRCPRRWVGVFACVWAAWSRGFCAEGGRFFLTESSPFMPFDQEEETRYNLKWGRMTGRVSGGLHVEGNDNIGLSDQNPLTDVSFTPQAVVGFLWPISQSQVLRFDLGAGYQWYLDNPELSSLYIRPGSQLTLQLRMENVRIELRDEFQVQMDATSQREISGGPESVADFRRFSNTSGLSAFWTPNSYTRVSGGYEFLLDRSLSDEFTALDRDTHVIQTTATMDVAARWSAGLFGSFMVFRHVESIQNNGLGYSVGPVVLFHPSRFIEIEAMGGYSSIHFDASGSIEDRSDFDGFTGQLSVRHRMNSRMVQQLQFRQRTEIGYGSNFTEVLSAQYGLMSRLSAAVQLNAHVAYEHYATSGAEGESADRVLLSADTRFRLAPRWDAAVGYSFGLKASDQEERDYQQNRVTLEVTHAF